MFSSTTTTIPYVHPAVRSRVKRAIDVVGSLTGLTVLLVLLIPLAIAIRLDSPGPIFSAKGELAGGANPSACGNCAP
ncbi:MAG: hypothetical protein HC890_14445 [Chloroflexaceae bacterium]|nr:hypothetical protein [Chloroflexaceae bacterium]